MKFYYGSNIDNCGRICVGKLLGRATKVVLYMTDESNELFYIAPYVEAISDPDMTVRTVCPRGRICLPAWLRGKANRVLIGRIKGSDELVVKLIRD